MKKDIINHPSHYTQAALTITFEPVDLTERLPHPIASAVEYLLRAGKKEGVPEEVDLMKARWWLKRALNNQSLWKVVLLQDWDVDSLRNVEILKHSDPLRDRLLIEFARSNPFIDQMIYELSCRGFDFDCERFEITKDGVKECLDLISGRLLHLGVKPEELTE